MVKATQPLAPLLRPPAQTPAACSFLLPLGIRWALKDSSGYPNPVFIKVTHRGAAGFVNIGGLGQDASLDTDIELKATEPQAFADLGSG